MFIKIDEKNRTTNVNNEETATVNEENANENVPDEEQQFRYPVLETGDTNSFSASSYNFEHFNEDKLQ